MIGSFLALCTSLGWRSSLVNIGKKGKAGNPRLIKSGTTQVRLRQRTRKFAKYVVNIKKDRYM